MDLRCIFSQQNLGNVIDSNIFSLKKEIMFTINMVHSEVLHTPTRSALKNGLQIVQAVCIKHQSTSTSKY